MILTGAMGKDGTVAIGSRTKDAQSMLTVYNTKAEEIFVWKFSLNVVNLLKRIISMYLQYY